MGGKPFGEAVQAAVIEETPLVDQQHPAAEGGDVGHVVAGEQHGGAMAAVVIGEKLTHPCLGVDIETQGGFIEKENGRTMQQGRQQTPPSSAGPSESLAHRR